MTSRPWITFEALADVPALVLEHAETTEVAIWHPGGLSHPNARACVERYRHRGWTVIASPCRGGA